jgi:hypothetical protein
MSQCWRHNTLYNNIQRDDIQYKDTEHDDTQYNNIQHNTEYCSAKCRLFWVSNTSPLCRVSLCRLPLCLVSCRHKVILKIRMLGTSVINFIMAYSQTNNSLYGTGQKLYQGEKVTHCILASLLPNRPNYSPSTKVFDASRLSHLTIIPEEKNILSSTRCQCKYNQGLYPLKPFWDETFLSLIF